MSAPGARGTPEPFIHVGLLYRDTDDYLSRVGSFIEEGLAAGEPVLVTAPPAECDALRDRLGGRFADSDSVEFADMHATGANPARVIPAVRGFVERWPGRRTRAVGQPTWPGLGPAALREVARMEALVNLAFTGTHATFLCPYSVDGDAGRSTADPGRTHPRLQHAGDPGPSADYSLEGLLVGRQPEPEPTPTHAERMRVTSPYALAELRGVVAEAAAREQVDGSQVSVFEVAVTEAATNALLHGGGAAHVALWRDTDEQSLVCEVRSAGRITDPLVGCVQPNRTSPGGRGMWLINQLCDLAETHSGPWGTVVRMHLRVPGSSAGTPTV
jgi:anti-sigma regulatory factor (Ser/Thr protein kinase)